MKDSTASKKKRIELNKTMGIALQAVIGTIKLLGMGEGVIQAEILFFPESPDCRRIQYVVCTGYTDLDLPFAFRVVEDLYGHPLADFDSADNSGLVISQKERLPTVRWARRYTRGFRFEKIS